MPRRTHRQEHTRKKAIRSGMKAETYLPFTEEEEIVITGEVLPFILTHFFPKDKQKQIRRFIHELKADKKKRAKKHAKRADSLEEIGCYRDEHPLHNTHRKILNNRKESGLARSKNINKSLSTHKQEYKGKKKR
ncbi:hypothetical protein EB008_00065 [bacterium]|nr:hypothetical protein [bacterium]